MMRISWHTTSSSEPYWILHNWWAIPKYSTTQLPPTLPSNGKQMARLTALFPTMRRIWWIHGVKPNRTYSILQCYLPLIYNACSFWHHNIKMTSLFAKKKRKKEIHCWKLISNSKTTRTDRFYKLRLVCFLLRHINLKAGSRLRPPHSSKCLNNIFGGCRSSVFHYSLLRQTPLGRRRRSGRNSPL